MIGTMKLSLDSIVNGKTVRNMTDEEKAAYIASQAVKGRICIIEGFNDNKEKPAENNRTIVNNTIVQKSDEPDYWTRFEHQAAIAAMQGMLSNPEVDLDYKSDEYMPQAVAATAYILAHALMEKYKKEEK